MVSRQSNPTGEDWGTCWRHYLLVKQRSLYWLCSQQSIKRTQVRQLLSYQMVPTATQTTPPLGTRSTLQGRKLKIFPKQKLSWGSPYFSITKYQVFKDYVRLQMRKINHKSSLFLGGGYGRRWVTGWWLVIFWSRHFSTTLSFQLNKRTFRNRKQINHNIPNSNILALNTGK